MSELTMIPRSLLRIPVGCCAVHDLGTWVWVLHVADNARPERRCAS
jgi:cell division FtsZ-interacting protein ZapD